MAKYIVETYYTCNFKVKHYLDDISNNQLDQLDKRDDGEFEILDVKFDKRNTKNLEKNKSNIELKFDESSNASDLDEQPIVSKNVIFSKKWAAHAVAIAVAVADRSAASRHRRRRRTRLDCRFRSCG